jgi:hypothetical protein
LNNRVIVTVGPHTTEIRDSRFEIPVHAPFLRPGAFLSQGVSTYSKAWEIGELGAFKPDGMEAVPGGPCGRHSAPLP